MHTQQLLAPLTANQPTSATNPEQRSAVANKTTSVTRVVSGRFNSVLRSTPERANDITITTNATRPDWQNRLRCTQPRKEANRGRRNHCGNRNKETARKKTCATRRNHFPSFCTVIHDAPYTYSIS